MKITTVLPVSRLKYIDRVLGSLSAQTLKPSSLLVVFNGNDRDFAEVRNAVVSLEFENVLCVNLGDEPAPTIPERRKKIAALHNKTKELIGDADWVFSIEDDGVLPRDALRSLVKVTREKENVGLVTGVELGRWGTPYVGAWEVDSVFDIQVITSLENKSTNPSVEPIDASGLYCALIRADLYKSHTFFCDNGLGPDVNLGIHSKRVGFENYIDWGVHVKHLGNHNGKEVEINATDEAKVVHMKLQYGNVWQITH